MARQDGHLRLLSQEARGLFEANLQARGSAQRTTGGLFTLLIATLLVGIGTGLDAVAIPLAPATLIVLSLLFQQYGEVTVLGTARLALEREISSALQDGAKASERSSPACGGSGSANRSVIPLYETAVAPIRKRRPLVLSVRALQVLCALVVVATVVAGAVVAAEARYSAEVQAGFALFTTVGLISAALSYRDMLRSGRIAEESLRYGG